MKDLLKKIDVSRTLGYLLFMFLTLLAQNMVLSHIRPLDVCPMVLPAAAAAVGMFEGPVLGAVFGTVMGIFADMAFVEHTVFFVVMLPILAFGAAFLSQFFINRRFVAFMGAAFLSSLLCAGVQLLKTLAGDEWCAEMLTVAVLQALWSMPFAAIIYFAPTKWIKQR